MEWVLGDVLEEGEDGVLDGGICEDAFADRVVAAGEGGANDCLTGGPFCNLFFIFFFFSGGAVGGGGDANGEMMEGFG